MAAAAKRKVDPQNVALPDNPDSGCLGAVLAAVLIPLERTPKDQQRLPAGEIVVGVDASFPPFALDDGRPCAGSISTSPRAIAAELGNLPVRFSNIGFTPCMTPS